MTFCSEAHLWTSLHGKSNLPGFSLFVIYLRIWSGPDGLRPQLCRPQPAGRLVRGPDSTARRRPPTYCKRVRQGAEPQRTGLPSVSTLTTTPGLNRCVKLKEKKKSQGNLCFCLKNKTGIQNCSECSFDAHKKLKKAEIPVKRFAEILFIFSA